MTETKTVRESRGLNAQRAGEARFEAVRSNGLAYLDERRAADYQEVVQRRNNGSQLKRGVRIARHHNARDRRFTVVIARRRVRRQMMSGRRRLVTRTVGLRPVAVTVMSVWCRHRGRRRCAHDLARLQRHGCAGDYQRNEKREEPFHHQTEYSAHRESFGRRDRYD